MSIVSVCRRGEEAATLPRLAMSSFASGVSALEDELVVLHQCFVQAAQRTIADANARRALRRLLVHLDRTCDTLMRLWLDLSHDPSDAERTVARLRILEHLAIRALDRSLSSAELLAHHALIAEELGRHRQRVVPLLKALKAVGDPKVLQTLDALWPCPPRGSASVSEAGANPPQGAVGPPGPGADTPDEPTLVFGFRTAATWQQQ